MFPLVEELSDKARFLFTGPGNLNIFMLKKIIKFCTFERWRKNIPMKLNNAGRKISP